MIIQNYSKFPIPIPNLRVWSKIERIYLLNKLNKMRVNKILINKMDTKEKEWEELFKGIDFKESNILQEDKNLDENLELAQSFSIYFNDYCKISYLNDIKESHLYLLNKWKFIFFTVLN